jgi:ATP-independent RNA helicase DbpA
MPASFASLELSVDLLTVVEQLGFVSPTEIQQKSIPSLLAGRDLVGKSQTGSGKTAAFALPLLQNLPLENREVHAIVLCPTRELCAQVAREIRKLGRLHPGLVVAKLTGGEPLAEQAKLLRRGAHIVVGTPGRVLDQLGRRHLRVHRVRFVVLDEADRMLDMGFKPDIEKVLRALPAERQTALFSATFPESIDALSREYQKEPIVVGIETTATSLPNIEQIGIDVDLDRKLEALLGLLTRYPHENALVFANLKLTVANLETALRDAGVSAESLHGDLEQFDRDRVMAKFRNGSTRVLVATDVAARGIDLDNLDLVVNYDMPSQPEVYVHRIGRTARAGKAGLAVSLCTANDRETVTAIEQLTQVPIRFERGTAPLATRSRATEALSRAAAMDTLRISGGRKEKLRPGDILGALTGEAGKLDAAEIGKIEIHDHFAYVAIAKARSNQALLSLRDGRIKGRRFRVDVVK